MRVFFTNEIEGGRLTTFDAAHLCNLETERAFTDQVLEFLRG